MLPRKSLPQVTLLFLLLIPTATFAQRQPPPADIQSTIDSVFGSNGGGGGAPPRPPPPTPARSRGFANVVTPEPFVAPTTGPVTLKQNTPDQCTCVPYHMCDPANNMIRTGADAVDEQFDGFGVIDVRFDQRECQAVLDVCCRGQFEREETIPVKPVEQTPNRAAGCGIRNVGGIDFQLAGANNYEAGFGEFPWTVALIRIEDDELVCVGSLIHPKAVLTGNHCVKPFLTSPKELKIRAGEWDTQTTKERLPYKERLVGRIFSHPSYNDRSLANDVAIIELEDPFTLADNIGTICLPPQNYVSTSKNCFASGWGKDTFGREGKFSVIMKRVQLPIVPYHECEQRLKQTRLTEKFHLDQSFLCAGGEPGVDTCQGDGGAPLVCPVGNPAHNRYAQSGIVAWGIGCNEAHPAVYANVALARDWIDSQIRYIGLDTAYYTYY